MYPSMCDAGVFDDHAHGGRGQPCTDRVASWQADCGAGASVRQTERPPSLPVAPRAHVRFNASSALGSVCAPLPGMTEGAYEPVLEELLASVTRDDGAPLGRPLQGTPQDGGVYGALTPPPPSAPLAPPSAFARWRRVMAKAARGGGNVTVLVLGGSMTAGVILDGKLPPESPWKTANSRCANRDDWDDKPSLDCAWPARLVHWLRTAYPKTRWTLHNRAVGATTCRTILGGLLGGAAALAPLRAGIVLINYNENDAVNDRGWDFTGVAAAYEQLLRLLLALPGHPAVLDVEARSRPLPCPPRPPTHPPTPLLTLA